MTLITSLNIFDRLKILLFDTLIITLITFSSIITSISINSKYSYSIISLRSIFKNFEKKVYINIVTFFSKLYIISSSYLDLLIEDIKTIERIS